VSPRAPEIAGIILAAGESRRMGSPKALLPYRGVTFLNTLIDLLSTRCQPVIVVLGAHADAIRAAQSQPSAAVREVYNEHYLTGQTSSLLAGLRAVPADTAAVLFTPVDHPAISAATIHELLAPPLPLIRIPRYAGERGHPILIRRDLIADFLALPPDAPANRVTRAHRPETEFIDVDDPGVIADIDDPAAYRELLALPTRSRA
jgi:molybdenum cofactor cytidylyltransferase